MCVCVCVCLGVYIYIYIYIGKYELTHTCVMKKFSEQLIFMHLSFCKSVKKI